MEDDTVEQRPKRQKRESSYKAKAFERFKQLKSGLRNKYDMEEVDNVYDTVDEREYTKKVLARQDDDWIVDDDGSGYVEDGRDIFDDDLDKESIAAAAASSDKKGVKRKKKVAAHAGKGNLHSLISNMPTKKKEEVKLDDDEALAELMEEIRSTPSTSATPLKPKPVSTNFSPLSVKRAEKEYMNKFASNLKRPAVTITKSPAQRPAIPKIHEKEISNPFKKVSKEVQNKENRKSHTVIAEDTLSYPEEIIPDSLSEAPCVIPDSLADAPVIPDSLPCRVIPEIPLSEPMPEIIPETQQPLDVIPDTPMDDCFNDDLDMSLIEASEEQTLNVTKKLLLENFEEDMLKDWAAYTEFSDTLDASINLENSDIPLTDVDNKKVFRFFWWDAYEDASKQPGVVFLFGKTYHGKTKSYISCCVAVRNIERQIFFLPRVTKENSDQPVTSQDVYNEINVSVMKNLQIKNFKARPISKKFAFDPQIPTESDYFEVRYSARDPPVSKTAQGRTFSRVFGTESSYLEILLLDRKIKGPCWLDISNPSSVINPVSWCKLEVNCNKVTDISIAKEVTGRPPLVVSSINMRCTINPKTGSSEIVMLSCITNVSYSVDKQAPTEKFFQKHFCVFTHPDHLIFPVDMHSRMKDFKATTLQKMNSEKALLNYFTNQFSKLDCDLVVGHDLQGYQINVLSERLIHHQFANFSKLGRIKRSLLVRQKLERELFVGRLVCDVKTSAKELIRCRSYDLESLCQAVLKLPDGHRVDLEPEEVLRMFETSGDVLKLVVLTMQDTAFILRIMYCLNIIPLALQITNIAGNVMSKTLMGGRSERNEFLLLHAFSEKGYIPPDKSYGKKNPLEKKASKKKPTYSGGLVLDPKVGFYDKLILLMDFNSLYPSIIQEYNICFTTMPADLSEDNMALPDRSLPSGILPTEIRKLVESRREVKKLMNNPDLSPDQRMQYHIRQMALKLTANSMYGCLGFSNSRFFAKNLAALITHKGREILTDTKDIVQRMNYEVIYGDTDSLMINTNMTDYDQVSTIGNKIKQEINKLYKQVELDIDGVFKYLLLLKKKKYAAVILSKTKTGELKTETEYKGLDIVRRDWSKLASEAGKFILSQILSDQSADDRVTNILEHLRQLKDDLESGMVPVTLLIITKQLTKNPNQYSDANSQPHVQVALRYNKDCGGHLRAGDAVPYVICDDGTTRSATQRAYHVEELRNSKELKVDIKYYLAQQIHPVISRICQPIEELDDFQIADCLGVDSSNFKRPKQVEEYNENITKPEIKYRDCEKFVFKCYACQSENVVDAPVSSGFLALAKCANQECTVRPVDYIGYILNQLVRSINRFIEKYYLYEMYCEDPACTCETVVLPLNFHKRFPVCPACKNAVLLKKYTENDLYSQISYFHYVFDWSRCIKKPIVDYQIEKAYQDVKETIETRLNSCGYSSVNLGSLMMFFEKPTRFTEQATAVVTAEPSFPEEEECEDED